MLCATGNREFSMEQFYCGNKSCYSSSITYLSPSWKSLQRYDNVVTEVSEATCGIMVDSNINTYMHFLSGNGS